MSVWLLASIVLACGFIPCTVAALSGGAAHAVAALNVAAGLSVVVLVTLTMAFQRQPFIDLAVVLTPLSIVGALAFVRFLERQ